jgi:hypothetical protein
MICDDFLCYDADLSQNSAVVVTNLDEKQQKSCFAEKSTISLHRRKETNDIAKEQLLITKK